MNPTPLLSSPFKSFLTSLFPRLRQSIGSSIMSTPPALGAGDGKRSRENSAGLEPPAKKVATEEAVAESGKVSEAVAEAAASGTSPTGDTDRPMPKIPKRRRKSDSPNATMPYREPTPNKDPEVIAQEVQEGRRRLPKKKAAILIGYCGTGYSGMQIQTHGSRTIEGDVFEALVKAGAVSEENSVDHKKVAVARAARTDAGVHAAGNCISMKMIIEPPLPPEHKTLASYVNSFLPEQIRMWGFVRTMKSFVARTACDSRKYEYLLPSYCLLPPAAYETLARRLDASSPGWTEGLGSAWEFANAGVPLPPREQRPKEGERGQDDEEFIDPRMRGEYERRRGWRVDQDTMTRFRELIAQYKATHNFHNYTVAKPFNDKTVHRHMMALEVKDPQVVGEIEWISVQIHGQSFMLHQIRKMIAMAILACRTNSPPSLIKESYGPKKIHIPKAPALGLLLEAPQFGYYNKRIQEKPNGLQGERDPIDWNVYAEEMQAFKLKWIYEKLRQDELELNTFHKWIRQVDCNETGILAFLNTKGEIPAEAEVTNSKSLERKDDLADKKARAAKELDSDDEEIDQNELKRGDLEG